MEEFYHMVEGTDTEVTFCTPHLVKWSIVEKVLFITYKGRLPACILILIFEKWVLFGIKYTIIQTENQYLNCIYFCWKPYTMFKNYPWGK